MNWTFENINYLKKVYSYNSNYSIAKYFGISYSAIKNKANKLNLKKDIYYINKGCFKKGDIPWNKGIKGLNIGGIQTQFKKNHMPYNTKSDGAITIRRDKKGRDYKYIRLSSGVWELYHRYLWKQKYGKISDDMILIFKDGNSMNCNCNNLQPITKRDNMRRNTNRLKASDTIKKTWKSEKIRALYGLDPRTKLMERCKNHIKQLQIFYIMVNPYLREIRNKLINERAVNLSDKEIDRCFKNAVAYHKLTLLAKKYRDNDILNIKQLQIF